MGKVYNWGLLISEHLKQPIPDLERYKLNTVSAKWTYRWEQLHSDLHAAGFALDPEFHQHAAQEDLEIKEGFQRIVEKLLPEDEQVAALMQFSEYLLRSGAWGREMPFKHASGMPAHMWWMQYGAHCPALCKVAMKVLSQVSSACSCERNWSTYSFIHSKNRNRLAPKRAETLVYVFSNLRLAEHATDVENTQRFFPWASQSSPADVLKDVSDQEFTDCED
jgi:hAT family C-terminal dimerisation region